MRELATLQRKTYSDPRAERLLADTLRGRGGRLTRADAAALTGLSTAEADGALRSLVSTYRSHLAVTDDGELVYQFDPAMTRRDEPPLRELLADVGRAAWATFTILFKILIAVTLVAYVVAFVAMLIALVFARSSNDRDSRRSRDGGGGFPWMIWWLMPDLAPPDVQRRQRRLDGRPRKRFYRSVFDFVFGPPSTPADALAAEKEVVAYLRAHEGRLTATDLVALTGWSYERADEEATRLLADYDGEPEVADDGTLIYTFPSLRRTADAIAPTDRQLAAAPAPRALRGDVASPAAGAIALGGGASDGGWHYAWQEPRALAPLTGNTPGTDAVIGAMNGFNLFAGMTIGPAFLERFGLAGSSTAVGLVTLFPLAFSSVFFAVPAGRWVRRRGRRRRLIAAALRAELLRAIVEGRGAPVVPDELARAAEARVGAAPGQGARALDRLLRDLDGDVTTDEAGAVRYAFPRVAEELAAAQAARVLAPASERAPGEVIFSSDD